MPAFTPKTVGDFLYWSYANLAMAHAGVTRGAEKYGRVHYIIRAKLRKGLSDGTMNIGSLARNERLKMTLPPACCYCGADTKLTADHLISTSVGGPDTGDNLVWACRSCNSSKGRKDFVAWWSATRDEFPPLLLLQRYLKLAIQIAIAEGAMELPLDGEMSLPFDLNAIPTRFPRPTELRLWIVPL